MALGMVAMSGFLIGLALCFFLVKQGLLCGKSRFLQYICAVMEDSDDGKNAGSTWVLIMFVALIMLGARFTTWDQAQRVRINALLVQWKCATTLPVSAYLGGFGSTW